MSAPHLPGEAEAAGDASPGTAADVSAEVLESFRRGDVAALGVVYDRYVRAVWSVAMTVLRDRSLAEDATQEVFLRAWRACGTFDPARGLAPWLFTIARRTAIDVHRHESRPTQGGHAGEQDAAVGMPGIEHAYETWQVRAALAELPEDERAVIRMSHYEEMTHREIADALAVPLGTVKSRSHRAHRRLAGRLAHLLGGGDE